MNAGTIGQRFDPRANALNFLRLCLALEVVVWHAYALRGSTWLPSRVEAFLGDIAVDGFFAISGFLIVRSWESHPHAGRFLLARARRILPGFWVCLLVTAFVIAPAAATSDRFSYVTSNWTLVIHQWGIGRTGVWDGSLWSLKYEVGCYLAVVVLGLLRVLRPGVVLALGGTAWLMAALMIVDGVAVDNFLVWLIPRCLLMFAAGGLVWLLRDRIPFDTRLAWLAACSVLAGVVLLPADYRLVAAPGIAYLMIWAGVRLSHPRLVLRNDLSYGVYVYGFPIQQALLLAGVSLGWFGFTMVSVACVLPVAALSWFLIERPAQRFGRRRVKVPAPVETYAAA